MRNWLFGQTFAPGTRPKQRRKRTYAWIAAPLFFATAVHGQISPGPLSRAHQSLNGDASCIKCHEVSTRSPSFRCLECHKEIATEIDHNSGLHATFPRGGTTGSACVKCHSDHNGVDFQMIHWNPTGQGFDHSKTGYTLDGKHVGVSCRACHTAQHISAVARGLLQVKDLNRTWMGLSPTCSTCHADPHQGRFGPTCTQCHSTSEWKGARVERENFDHSKTPFPLLGAHKAVLCQSCHTGGTDGQPRWSGLKFANCSDCHSDPHKGEFKPGCDSCHTTVTWKRSSFAGKFDHSKTAFPLMGRHAEVDCIACHKGEDFKQPLAHAACADCHTPDPHGGQFANRADGGKCESCHTVDGWSPSKFTIADHAKTGYPIVFPHTKVACAQCHVPAGNATKFKMKSDACVDCHKDEHEGQFAGAPYGNRCEQCHNGASFKTTSYTLPMHQKSSYPLTGSHMAVACNECHKPQAGSQTAVYHFNKLGCMTCHEDVHHGEFAKRMAVVSKTGKLLGCEACHSTKEWSDLAKFDHDQTKFPLLGSHRAVSCAECHKPPNLELTLVHVHFASASTACDDCHENPHADQFGARGKDCASCHNSNKWRPALFDHERTAFSLKGAHEDVPCASCHTLKRQIDGSLVLFYKPTPTACVDCHGTDSPKPKGGSNGASIQFR